jgi:L-threonylcarbamoyladenylate synthase
VRRYDCRIADERVNGLVMAASVVRRDRLVVLPTDTVYGVACDAFSRPAVEALQRARGRVGGPGLPVMVGSPRTVDGLAMGLTAKARDLMAAFWPGSLTLLFEQQPSLSWSIGSEDTVAVRMPLHPLMLDLLRDIGPMAVLPASRVGQAAPLTCDDATGQLDDQVEVYLDAGPMLQAAPSTIVDMTGADPVLRRPGAISLEQLRAVEPSVRAVDDESAFP